MTTGIMRLFQGFDSSVGPDQVLKNGTGPTPKNRKARSPGSIPSRKFVGTTTLDSFNLF